MRKRLLVKDTPIAPDALRRWRKSLNYTQTELGYHLGVSRRTITRWEHGHCDTMPVDLQARMAKLRRFEDVIIAREPDHATPDWKRKLFG